MKCLTGSRYFFSQYEDFNSKDKDNLELLDTNEFDRKRLYRDENGESVFQWKIKPKDTMIEEMQRMIGSNGVCSFLIPEFANEIKLTINDLKLLEQNINDMIEKYPKYQYYRIIYDAYLENNSFTLTEEQRLDAYNNYKATRPEKYNL